MWNYVSAPLKWLIVGFLILTLCSCGPSGSDEGQEGTKSTTVGSVSVSSSSSEITANGTDNVKITTTVKNDDQEPLSDVAVNFYKIFGSSGTDGNNAALLSSAAAATAETGNHNFTGTGSKVTSTFSSQGGNTTFTSNCNGDEYFSVWLWSTEEGKVALLASETDAFEDTQVVENLDEGNYFLEVIAGPDKDWNVDMEGAVTGESSPEFLATVKTDGSGKAVYTYTSTKVKSDFFIEAEVDQNGTVHKNSTAIKQKAGEPANIELNSSKAELYANGKNATLVAAIVRDIHGNLVEDGAEVSFNHDGGGTLNETVASTQNGIASVELQSSDAASSSTVSASIDGLQDSEAVNVTFKEIVMTNMVATPSTIISGDGKTVTITVQLKDQKSIAVNGETIHFTTTAGTLTSGSAVTGDSDGDGTVDDDTGMASVTLIPSVDEGSAQITASYGNIEKTVQVVVKTEEAVVATATYLSIATSKTAIKTNGDDSATITATVLDENKVAINGTTVGFNTTGGKISASTATSNQVGEASIQLSSGPDKTNQTVTIEASVQGQDLDAVIIPVKLIGSSVNLAADVTSLSGGEDATSSLLVITVTDGGDVPVYGADVTISQSGNGSVTLTPAAGTTDVNGKLEVTVKGNNNGDVILEVTALGDKKEQTFTISGDPFEIITPSKDSIAIATNASLDISVRSPQKNDVQFTTTMGNWNNGKTIDIVSPGNENNDDDIATATLNTGDIAGTITVKVEDVTDNSVSDTLFVAVAAPSDEASKLTIQVSPSVIAPSSGGLSNVASLKATVKNDAGQIVSGAAVLFSLFRTTGGGETINPPIVYTGSNGEAETTFTSGSLGSDSLGVFCLGKLSGAAVAGPDNKFAFSGTNISRTDENGSFIDDGFKIGDSVTISGSGKNDGTYTISDVEAGKLTFNGELFDVETPGETLVIATEADTDVVQVKISGDGSSVAIGGATEIEELNPSTYKYPMSVLVADSNGNPVTGAAVNLSVWPTYYWTGITGEDGPVRNNGYPNEDLNRNDMLDAGEDTDGPPSGEKNGQLDPAKSAAGTVPATVTTDENGVAQFDYVYQKNYAGWLDVEIKATTLVYGSETTSVLNKALGWLEEESSSIPNSPWGP
jgi:hypothetical protein